MKLTGLRTLRCGGRIGEPAEASSLVFLVFFFLKKKNSAFFHVVYPQARTP